MLRNIILDWSGTLADDLAPVADATNLIFRHFGRPELLLEEFREKFRLPFSCFYEELLPGVQAVELETLYHTHFIERQHTITLLPHTFDFLQFAQASSRRLFLLSTIKPEHYDYQSVKLGVRQFFEKAYVGITDKRECIHQLLQEHGLSARETAFIGDMMHDVEAARHGGVMAIAVLTGFDSPAKLMRAEPDLIVRDLGELQRLLEAPSPNDQILIQELELFVRIGVPDEERGKAQRLTVSAVLVPRNKFSDLTDDLAETVDYAQVCQSLRNFVAGREDKLLETLANEMASHLLHSFPLTRVKLELRKFVLPETRYVAVQVDRQGMSNS